MSKKNQQTQQLRKKQQQMKKQIQQEKDLFLIAKKIKNQQIQQIQNLDHELQLRFQKQSEQALKMINAYRKVQNIKLTASQKNTKNESQKNQTTVFQQPKSTYANKVKQTLRELNINRAKQYEKLLQKNIEMKELNKAQPLKIENQISFKIKLQQQHKLISKSAEKIGGIWVSVLLKIKKRTLSSIVLYSESLLQNQLGMARKYRLFRLFSLWKSQTTILKLQNQKKREQETQNAQKQIQANEIAKEFYLFTTYKKTLKYWSKLAKLQVKKRKYEQEISQIQTKKQIPQKQERKVEISQQPENSLICSQLQNKLKGFLQNLKQKIQHKPIKPNLEPIIEKFEESQPDSNLYLHSDQHNQVINPLEQQPSENIKYETQEWTQSNTQNQKQPLSNEQLQKRRNQIYQRSKQRKQALQKLKKQKQFQKRKQQQQRKQLQKKIEQQNKRTKQLKYKEFQQRKKLEKQWQQRQHELNIKADHWSKLRIIKFYGFDQWKCLKTRNLQKAQKIKDKIEKIMIKHAGTELIENLGQNLEYVLQSLYLRVDLAHARNLKKKCIKGFKKQLGEVSEQTIQLQTFHEAQTQKVFFCQWKAILDMLRLQNIQEQRPLIKKSNEYHRVSLLFKSLKGMKQHMIESKKQKNITQQKLQIKNKIKSIISEKIQINIDDFL